MAVVEVPENLASRAWVSPARLRRSRTTFIRTYNYNASVAESRGSGRRHSCTSVGSDVEEPAVRFDDRRVARRVHDEDRSHRVGVLMSWLLCSAQCAVLCYLHDATGHTHRRRFGRIRR
jgi:hypothetical protein